MPGSRRGHSVRKCVGVHIVWGLTHTAPSVSHHHFTSPPLRPTPFSHLHMSVATSNHNDILVHVHAPHRRGLRDLGPLQTAGHVLQSKLVGVRRVEVDVGSKVVAFANASRGVLF